MRLRSWTRIPNLSVYGAPVYIHWSALVGIAFLGLLGLSSPIYAGLAIASYLAVIGVHELGHAYVARRLGYRVEAVRLAVIHGACDLEAPDTEWEEVLISWGGIAAQIIVAAVVLLVAAAIGDRDAVYFGPVIVFLGYFNLMIAFVNLAPASGLDGAIAWRIIPLTFRLHRARRGAAKTLSVLKRRK